VQGSQNNVQGSQNNVQGRQYNVQKLQNIEENRKVKLKRLVFIHCGYQISDQNKRGPARGGGPMSVLGAQPQSGGRSVAHGVSRG